MRTNSDHEELENLPAPTFGERLLFVIWLAGRELGVDNAKQFAEAVGKNAAQVSKWLREDPRPSWDSIQAMADAVGVSPLWLDQPTRPGATVPEDFPLWLRNRRRRQQELRQPISGAQ